MLNTAIRFFQLKWTVLFLSFLLVVGTYSRKVNAQKITPSFKIIGKIQHVLEMGPMSDVQSRTVEYDSISPDHLYLSDFGKNGQVLGKTQFQFKGLKFTLKDLSTHFSDGELIKDGVQKIYAVNDTLSAELIYKDGTLQQQTTYHDNGNKEMQFSGQDGNLNGAFLMWHPNGQLRFSGNYLDNQKEGEFASFDTSGKVERKGIYKTGKLISGEPVIQDLVYNKPEIPARYKMSDAMVNEVLLKKTAHLDRLKKMSTTSFRMLNVDFLIDEKGKISKFDIVKMLDTLDKEVIKTIFDESFENFEPAMHEGLPVRSNLILAFLITHQGWQKSIPSFPIKKDTANKVTFRIETYYCHDMQMPEFIGGDNALIRFISKNIQYPPQAQKQGIQGRVYVNFGIDIDGSISDVSLMNGVHPLLNEEAKRVVRSMPYWVPGRMDGKKVKVHYTIPINFVLQ